MRLCECGHLITMHDDWGCLHANCGCLNQRNSRDGAG